MEEETSVEKSCGENYTVKYTQIHWIPETDRLQQVQFWHRHTGVTYKDVYCSNGHSVPDNNLKNQRGTESSGGARVLPQMNLRVCALAQ